MRCPFCSSDNTRVLESRAIDDGAAIRRRRECAECSKRFTSYERLEQLPIIVIKSNLNKEVFSREKLLKSIVRACSKTQLSTLTIDRIVDDVESEIYKKYHREISSQELGSLVMRKLKEADALAYIRYASIFKNFTSLVEFIDEIKEMEDSLLGLKFEDLDFNDEFIEDKN
jgi:transcriptional repressor NrdR